MCRLSVMLKPNREGQLLRKTALHVPEPELCAHHFPVTEYLPETKEKLWSIVPVSVPLAFASTKSITNEFPFKLPLRLVAFLQRLETTAPETVLPAC